jgi:hypothetical protein
VIKRGLKFYEKEISARNWIIKAENDLKTRKR